MSEPRRLEFGWVLEDGSYLCDGCSVRPRHEHRCHGSDGAWADGRACECRQCGAMTNPRLEA